MARRLGEKVGDDPRRFVGHFVKNARVGVIGTQLRALDADLSLRR
jgi:hypothetical protein